MPNRVLAERLYKALKDIKLSWQKSFPILNYARMEFTNGELHVVTTDREEFYGAVCPSIMNESWCTCVPMATRCDVSNTYKPKWHTFYPFFDFVRLHAEWGSVLDMEFLSDIQTLVVTVQGERTRTEFKCIDALEFPIPDELGIPGK